MTCEELHSTTEFQLTRKGRFLIAALLSPHRVLSTSSRNGGQQENVRFLVNHQSCEASAHGERQIYIRELGLDGYHDAACREIDLPPDSVAMMGTAANMNYASVVTKNDLDLSVTAIVTAGVQGNAACAGDPAAWRETNGDWEKVIPYTGTINTIVLVNRSLTDGALARAVVTMTEAKSAALQRLAVRSLYSKDAATGTGTDQYCVAAPSDSGRPLTSTGPHVKLGEIIGLAVRDATLEALRWQNGLEPSYTRGVFHALGHYGLTEARFFEDIGPMLTDSEFELLRRNSKSVIYEPLVSAAAYAVAAVLDRVRYGTLPAGTARESLRQQGATLAASLAAAPGRWLEFYGRLGDVDPDRPAPMILMAIALGWSSKWR
jgi:adenosylcobinamide amidohydrolase